MVCAICLSMFLCMTAIKGSTRMSLLQSMKQGVFFNNIEKWTSKNGYIHKVICVSLFAFLSIYLHYILCYYMCSDQVFRSIRHGEEIYVYLMDHSTLCSNVGSSKQRRGHQSFALVDFPLEACGCLDKGKEIWNMFPSHSVSITWTNESTASKLNHKHTAVDYSFVIVSDIRIWWEWLLQ